MQTCLPEVRLRELDLSRLGEFSATAACENGLWDLFVGYLFVHLAVISLFSHPGLNDFWGSVIWLPFCALVYRGIMRLKSRTAASRFGRMPSSGSGKFRFRRSRTILIAIAILNLISMIPIFLHHTGDWIHPAALALFMGTAFTGIGILFGMSRLAVYGAIAGVAVMSGYWLSRETEVFPHGVSIALGACGILAAVAGMTKFSIFMRRHPRSFVKGNW